MHRAAAAFGAALALAVAIPAATQAATLTMSGGTLTYTGAAPGAFVFFDQPNPAVGTIVVTNQSATDDPINATGSTCTGGPTVFMCTGVTLIVADGGAGDDGILLGDSIRIQLPGRLSGGSGNDLLTGGFGNDTLTGGPGDDWLVGNGGTDQFSGGAGIDEVEYFATHEAPPVASAAPVTVTLDGLANDGEPGENENVPSDVEDVSANSYYSDPATHYGSVNLTGDAAINTLTGGEGPDTLDGGVNSDVLYGASGDDTVNARDGFADRVYCGPGTDTVVADPLDQVYADCENVSIADVGNGSEDKPPTVAWAAPAAGTKLAGAAVAKLQATAADDKGVVSVQFIDDDRVVCTDTVAPYTCDYQPRGEDLGRNTLIVVATDAVGQTASSVRAVVVTRFSAPTLSLKASPAKDKKSPYAFTLTGKLALPAGVTPAQGCSGSITVTVKGKSKTLSTRTVKLNKTCSYKVKLTLRTRSGFPANGKLKAKATFAGNDTLFTKSSSTRTLSTA